MLRDLIDVIEAHPNSIDFPHFTRLFVFTQDELPFWRFMAAIDDPTSAPAQTRRELDKAGIQDPDDTRSPVERFAWRVRQLLLRDVQAAIERRVNAEP